MQDSTKSPCIDAGNPDTTGLNLPEIDLDGNPRIVNGRIDMGAYEWQYRQNQSTNNVLFQNYPNPFNPDIIGTTISYSLPKASNIKIMIYNIKGQLVETLVDAHKPAGYHAVELNAKDMSSGIYFYKLTTKDKTFIKKMILMR